MSAGAWLAALATITIGVGVLLLIRGLAGQVPRPLSPAARRMRRIRERSESISPRDRVLAAIGLPLGIAAYLFSGWIVMLAVVPIAVLGAPRLITPPRSRAAIAKLEGLEEWTRVLAGVLAVGIGLEQAIIRTQRSVPAAISGEVDALVNRLRSRWSSQDAMRQFADDLADPTGDLICAALISSAERRGPGLRDILESLAESVSDDVRARRQIEADRAKPRATAKWVTILTLAALAVLFLFNGEYLAPYASPTGQLVLALLVAGYIGALLWMRQIAEGAPIPRFLTGAA
ncbi:MAG: type II secretion system F family protein [Actinomycetia bacterium]|nr:type II secretion system F family protein [Actinomycetes bacterium]